MRCTFLFGDIGLDEFNKCKCLVVDTEWPFDTLKLNKAKLNRKARKKLKQQTSNEIKHLGEPDELHTQ